MKTKTIKTESWIISTIEDTDCLMIGGGDGSDVVADIRIDHPDAEQNAHLIASAPELYEALKRLTEQAAEELDQGATDDGIWNCKRLANARHALAHAEGRELGCI